MADAAEHLTHVGQESGNNKAVIWLWCMGAAVTKYMPEDVDNVIRSIEELEETISEDKVQSAESRCIENYPNLKDSFEKFKSQCNK